MFQYHSKSVWFDSKNIFKMKEAFKQQNEINVYAKRKLQEKKNRLNE